MAYILYTIDRNTPITAEQIRHLDSVRLREFILEYVSLKSGKAPNAFIDEIYLHLRIFKARLHSMLDYVPKVYPGSILYFRAQESVVSKTQEQQQAWIDLAAKGIQIHDVPGDHISMNMHPNVKVIAAILDKTLKR